MNLALHVPVCLNLHIKDNEYMFQNLHDARLKLHVHLHRSEKVKGGIQDLTLLPQKFD